MDVSGQNTGNDTFSVLYCARFCIPSFHKSVELFGTSIASLDPETVELPAFSILSAMFYRSVWPAREAKPHSDAMLECSVHDCETCLFWPQV